MNWIVIIVGTILSSLAYWAGGRGKDYSHAFIYSSIVRRAGCALIFSVCSLFFIEMTPINLLLVFLCFPAHWGALSTYWKSLQRLEGKRDEKVRWYNYVAHGCLLSLASIPLAFSNIGIWPVLARIPLLICLVGGFGLIKNAWISESLRGASIIATLIIFEVI